MTGWNLLRHQSQYQSGTLETALQEAFDAETRLFGGDNRHSKYGNKVSVTATAPTGDRAIILANYNRRATTLNNHLFDRPVEPLDELFVWEA